LLEDVVVLVGEVADTQGVLLCASGFPACHHPAEGLCGTCIACTSYGTKAVTPYLQDWCASKPKVKLKSKLKPEVVELVGRLAARDQA